MEEPFRRLSKAVATASKQVCFIPTDIAVEMQEEHQILRLIAGTTGTRNKNLTWGGYWIVSRIKSSYAYTDSVKTNEEVTEQ